MKAQVKTPEEMNDALDSAAPAQRRLEVGNATDTELPSGEVERAGGQISTARKRVMSRIIVTLIIVGIAGAGYLQRERLLDLIRSRDAGQSSTPGGQARKVLYWVDPMHPAYKSDKPGKAPDCGMDLVPVYEDGGEAASLPAGVVKISAEKQQLIGVTYGTVSYQRISKTLRAVGRVTYDETKVAHVHSRTEGWIEDVFVDFTGKEVKKGQPLVVLDGAHVVEVGTHAELMARGGQYAELYDIQAAAYR